MPSVSSKQHNFMAAVANNPAFAKKVGVPQSVGQDFTKADKKLKLPKSASRADLQRINSPKTNQGKNELFKKGGDTMKDDIKQDKGMMQKAVNKHEGRLHKGQPMTKLAKGGTFRASANGIATKGKTKATQITMKKGGKC